MEYIRFEDKYTDPYVEKTGNYLLNILLYETVGKAEYKKMVSMRVKKCVLHHIKCIEVGTMKS